MNISKELIEKAKTAKSAEELLELAKAENIELTAEQAKEYFATIHASGELSDEELAARPQQPLKRNRQVSKALRAYAARICRRWPPGQRRRPIPPTPCR